MYLKYGSKQFLLFLQSENEKGGGKIRCAVRSVTLKQFGHFMMGTARLFGKSFTVSGSYGSDGLPMTVPQEIYDQAPVELPQALYDAWNKGEGWNSAGKEAPDVRKWAIENLKLLTGKKL